MRKIITLSLAIVLFAACKSAAPEIGGVGTFDILQQATNGGREKGGNEVIKSQDKLNALYAELNLTDVPTIDFETSNVVALFMGQKNTGGYSISVSGVTLSEDTATVQIITTAPQDIATMALTEPYCFAKISKSKKVEFTKNATTPAAE